MFASLKKVNLGVFEQIFRGSNPQEHHEICVWSTNLHEDPQDETAG